MSACPDEVLGRILGHLHQPYHYHHYSLAILGEDAVPHESKPWSPVGLQRVSHRWQTIARPLFYRQLSLNARDPPSLRKLALMLTNDDPHQPLRARHPVFQSKLVVVCGRLSRDPACEAIGNLLVLVRQTQSRTREIIHPVDVPSTLITSQAIKRTWVCHDTPSGGQMMMGSVSLFCRLRTTQRSAALAKMASQPKEQHKYRTIGEETVVIRLTSQQGVLSTLRHFLRSIVEHPFIPHLKLDFPFALTPALLDSIGPILKSILRHPSLHVDRTPYLLEYDNPRNTIAFGTHTYDDAQALWTRIEGFGELEVDVEVDVLVL